MGDRLDLDLSREKQEKRTRWLIWAESLVIFGLLVWVSIEYESNKYLQDWLSKNIGPIGFLFDGTLAGLYAGALVGYALATYMGRRSEEEKILDSISRKNA
jgi:hypothetical protein